MDNGQRRVWSAVKPGSHSVSLRVIGQTMNHHVFGRRRRLADRITDSGLCRSPFFCCQLGSLFACESHHGALLGGVAGDLNSPDSTSKRRPCAHTRGSARPSHASSRPTHPPAHNQGRRNSQVCRPGWLGRLAPPGWSAGQPKKLAKPARWPGQPAKRAGLAALVELPDRSVLLVRTGCDRLSHRTQNLSNVMHFWAIGPKTGRMYYIFGPSNSTIVECLTLLGHRAQHLSNVLHFWAIEPQTCRM